MQLYIGIFVRFMWCSVKKNNLDFLFSAGSGLDRPNLGCFHYLERGTGLAKYGLVSMYTQFFLASTRRVLKFLSDNVKSGHPFVNRTGIVT